jgi:hypothetical protein
MTEKPKHIIMFFFLLLILQGLTLYGQSPQVPRISYFTLEGGYNPDVAGGTPVCPSLDSNSDGIIEIPSLSDFQVQVETENAGIPGANSFEWVVYGGWIVQFNGFPASAMNQRTDPGDGNIRYSYYAATGAVEVTPGNWQSFITVEWDTTNFSTVQGWIAVRQSSQWGCSDEVWRIFENTIQNTPPSVFSPVPDPDMLLGFNQRTGFTLPLPNYNDDGDACSNPLTLSYRIYRPTSGVLSRTYNPADLTTLIVNLDVGTNRVVWTVSDGALRDSFSFNIIVDTPVAINRIGWNNPICFGGNSGKLYAHTLTASALLPVSAFRYILNDGVNAPVEQANSLFSNLIAGPYSLSMQVTYSQDTDWDGSDNTHPETTPPYNITLRNPAQFAVSNIPGQNGTDPDDPGLLVANAGCSDADDGFIEVSPAFLTPTNSSLLFNSATYLPLNLSYAEPISAISVAAWIKINSGNYGPIVSFDENAYFQLRVTTDINAPVAFEVPSGTVTSTQRVSDNKWHFVVGVFDGAAPNKLTIYIDGVPTREAGPAATTIGNSLITRFGYIGRKADGNSTFFNGTLSSTNFVGQIADVAIFKGTPLDSATVDMMYRMGYAGATNQWVLNYNPASLPSDAPYTDLMGIDGAPEEFARFITAPAFIPNDAPYVIDWTVIDDEESKLQLNDLPIGTYTLNIRDIHSCGHIFENYDISSNDNVAPIYLANLALFSTDVTQSSTFGTNIPQLAVDGKLGSTGYSQTTVEPTPWWLVRLASNSIIHVVRIYAQNPMTNFDVFISQDNTSWFEVTTYNGAANNYFEFLVNGTIGRNGAYLRIRSSGASDSIALREVEVWGQTPVVERVRNFYLGNPECDYLINTANDGSVDPLAWDACQGVTSVWSDIGGNSGTTINGRTLTLNNPYRVTWTATDNQFPTPNSSQIFMTYNLLDTIRPWFVTILPDDTLSMTWCDAQAFDLPIPDVSDNNWCGGVEQIASLTLQVGSYSYTAGNFNGVGVIRIAPEALSQGYRNLVWTVTDLGGLIRRDTVRVYVQTQPAITGIEKANISCNNVSDGQISIWRINKDISATTVDYLLNNGVTTTTYPTSFITGLSDAQYTVTIMVNGCESAPASYGGYPYVEISRPLPTDIIPTFFPPQCFGDTDGQISLLTQGGDAGSSLHFPGDASGLATSLSLTSVNAAGTVEALIYFDTLGVAMNDNAVFISKGTDFALRMINSQLTLIVGGTAIITDVANQFLFQEKTWYHVAATWSATGSNLYVYGFANLNGPPATAPTDGTVTMGENFLGFMRHVRIWSRALPSVEIENNLRFRSPPEPLSSCVMNFPLTSGSSSLQNLKGAGITKPASYTWQDKPYVWDNFPYTLDYRNSNINLPTGIYRITSKSVFGCEVTEDITLGVADNVPPTVKFFDGYGVEELYNTISRKSDTISRYETSNTNPVLANVAGDCWFIPFGGELDPYGGASDLSVYDNCGIAAMWHDLRGNDARGVAITDTTTLNGIALSGSNTITWYVSDGGNISDTTLVYLIRDNEPPVFSNEASDLYAFVNVSDDGNDDCAYTVSPGMFIPSVIDNCGVTTVENDLNNSATLDGLVLNSGTYNIRWIVFDNSMNSDTMYQEIVIHDDIFPNSSCTNFNAYLDRSGRASLDAEDLYGYLTDADNCGLNTISIATNVALLKNSFQNPEPWGGDYTACGGFPNAAKANDGNRNGIMNDCSVSSTGTTGTSMWWVDLGDIYDIKRIVVYPRSDGGYILDDFTVDISTSSTFATSVSYIFSGSLQFHVPTSTSLNGRYVRIRKNSNGEVLQLAEVEVYGVLLGAATQNVALGKDAQQYSTYHSAMGTPCTQNVSAARAVDGNTSGDFYVDCSVTHTSGTSPFSFNDWEWWEVDLGGMYRIDQVKVFDRTISITGQDVPSHAQRLYDFYILLADEIGHFGTYSDFVNSRTGDTRANNHLPAFWNTPPRNNLDVYYCDGPDIVPGSDGGSLWTQPIPNDTARYVRIWMDHSANPLNLAEVQVFGVRVDIPETYVDCKSLLSSPVTAIITVRDDAGNITQCDASITIFDNIPPTARANTMQVPINSNGYAVIRGIDVNNASYDNCSIEQYLVNQQDSMIIGCDSLGIEVSLWFTVVDGSGNRDSVLFDVVIEDTVGPTLIANTTQPVNLYLNDLGRVDFTPDLIFDRLLDPASGDNCGGRDGIVSITANPAFFVCSDITTGPHTVTITASDYYTNSTSITVSINVLDTIKPNVRARDVTIIVTGANQPIDYTQINNGSTDNCAIVLMWTNPATIATCVAQNMQVVLFARDAAGNVNSDTCMVRFEPALKILSIGMDDCTGGAGANWTANITGTPLTYTWTCLESQTGANWNTNKTDAFFNPPASSTSTLTSPPYNDQNINNGGLRVRLRVWDGVCQAVKIDTLWLFPGAGQPATTFDYEANECYGTAQTYTVPNAADTYAWSFSTLSGGGSFVGPVNAQSANVEWTRLAGNGNFTGIVQCLAGVAEGSGPSAKTCYAVYRWTVSVYGTPDPSLTQSGSPIDPFVCPNEDVVYTIGNVSTDYTWNWFPPAIDKGTVVAGGKNNDPTMTVRWANTNGAFDSIRVTAFNYINCSKTVSSGPITINDSDPPLFDFNDYGIVVPFVGVNGGTPVQRSCVNINSGDNVTFSPMPTSGGVWSWSGTNVSGSDREQVINNVTSSFSATAIYTSPSGLISTQQFNVVVGTGTTTHTRDAVPVSGNFNVSVDGGTGTLRDISNGEYVWYNGINFYGGITAFSARVASPNNQNQVIELWVGGPNAGAGGTQIGSVTVGSTGGWGNWQTRTGTITQSVSGTHNLYLVFRMNTGSNYLDVDFFTYSTTDLGCTGSNAIVTIPNTPNTCSAWLTALPVPEAYDECSGANLYSGFYTKSFSINSTPLKSGNENVFRTQNLNVGSYTVTWNVADLVGNTNVTPYAYTLVVQDRQAPIFAFNPADTTLIAGDDGCFMQFDEFDNCPLPASIRKRQVEAADNCASASSIQYARSIRGATIDTLDWRSNIRTENCATAPGAGIDLIQFNGGVSIVSYYTRDNVGNMRKTSFNVTVIDQTPPKVTESGESQFINRSVFNATGQCGAFVNIEKPSLALSNPWATDNCTDSEDIIVTYVRSDDRDLTINDLFPIGETTVTWIMTDESGNRRTKNQIVTVIDNEPPTMTFTVPTVTDTITYCDKDNIRLNIPTLWDNCDKIDSLRYTVTGPSSYNFTYTYRWLPVVTQTDLLPNIIQGNYNVVWTVYGSGYSRTSAVTPFYVQRQPLILSDPIVTNTSCPGVSDGTIVVNNIQAEPGYTVYYSVSEVGGDQLGNTFNDMAYGPYNYVHITVDGCRSPYRPITIVQNPPYVISGDVTNVWCADSDTGRINITTTGGYFSSDPDPTFEWFRGTVSGVQLFNGVDGITITRDAQNNDDISGLRPGFYTVRYEYDGCFAQNGFTIYAIDDVPPDIISFPILPSAATNLGCIHQVDYDEATRPSAPFTTYIEENLVPYIVDEKGCPFGVQYRLTNAQTSTLWLPTIEGLELIQGNNANRINIQITQNGYTWDELYEYTISVYDDIDPVAVPGTPSGVLTDPVGGGGVVIINAVDFNESSSDNCSDILTFEVRDETTNWGPTISFNCNDIDDTKTIWFKAQDEAGNVDSIQTASINITDASGPHFTNSLATRFVCATHQDVVNFTYMNGLMLLATDYYDNNNCEAVTLQYRVVHNDPAIGVLQDWTEGATGFEGDASYLEDGDKIKFFIGSTSVFFRAIDSSGNSSAMWDGIDGYESYIITVYQLPDPGTINNE